MRFETLDVLAPGLLNTSCNEAEILGSAVWLWMHSQTHREWPLHTLPALLLPAIKHRQFVLATENGKPVFFLSWAELSPEAERRYLANHPITMPEEDWVSGERIWFLDWIAPFGHTPKARRLVTRLFATRCMRALYHRGDTRGLKVMDFHGIGVMAEEARAWSALNPPLLPALTQMLGESSSSEPTV